jgi:Contact-dependent growth inhibition CdiA C-terminal domain
VRSGQFQARLQTNGGNYFVKGNGLPADVAIGIGIGIALDPLDAALAKGLGKVGGAVALPVRDVGGNGEIIGELNADGTVSINPTSSNSLSNNTNTTGRAVAEVPLLPAPIPQGSVRILEGATPDANEVRAAQGLSGLGLNVDLQPTAASRNLPGRTADMTVQGIGQVDVYTPNTTNPTAIARAIEGKNDQATGVVVQTNLPDKVMEQIANDTWKKPGSSNIQIVIFQKPDGSLVRFDRPGTQFTK